MFLLHDEVDKGIKQRIGRVKILEDLTRRSSQSILTRRALLKYGVCAGAGSGMPALRAADKWGRALGYPSGLGSPVSISAHPEYRVGNYSGGFERLFPANLVHASEQTSKLTNNLVTDFYFSMGGNKTSVEEYLNSWPVTGLLICRNDEILLERYRFDRSDEMRFTSWSMAKSVTSLLLGICLDKKLINSYDDTAAKYLPSLEDKLHGSVTLRNLSNMSSGAAIRHKRDNRRIYPSAFMRKDSDIPNTVAMWNQREEGQGKRFNYNELCPLTIGMVIRQVTGQSLSEFAQDNLWTPMGAERDATWLTDSRGNEFNCIGFGATLRDWGRLGQLIAKRGNVAGRQIVSERWIDEITSWGDGDSQVRYGIAGLGFGYKAHMWHWKGDGSRLAFQGHHSQRVIVDMPTRTVLVQTALDWPVPRELENLFQAAVSL